MFKMQSCKLFFAPYTSDLICVWKWYDFFTAAKTLDIKRSHFLESFSVLWNRRDPRGVFEIERVFHVCFCSLRTRNTLRILFSDMWSPMWYIWFWFSFFPKTGLVCCFQRYFFFTCCLVVLKLISAMNIKKKVIIKSKTKQNTYYDKESSSFRH